MDSQLIVADSGLEFRTDLCARPRGVAVVNDRVMTGFLVPCRLRTCPGCGDVRLNRATSAIWTAASLGECIYEGTVEDAEREALQKRVKRRGYQIRIFPQSSGHAVHFTTDPREGTFVQPPNLPLRLVLAWQEMTKAGRKCGGSRLWSAQSKKVTRKAGREFLGLTSMSIKDQIAVLHQKLGDQHRVTCGDDRWSLRLPDDVPVGEIVRLLSLRRRQQLHL